MARDKKKLILDKEGGKEDASLPAPYKKKDWDRHAE